MKLKDMKTKTPAQLQAHVETLRTAIADAHREKRSTKEKNIHQKRNTRKDIARALTIKREFELDNQEEA